MGRKSKLDLVRKWRYKHPTGKKVQCMRDLNLTRPTCDKYWDTCGTGIRKLPNDQAVERFRLENPNGRKVDCIRATGLDKKTVYKYWDRGIEIKKDSKSQQFFFDF